MRQESRRRNTAFHLARNACGTHSTTMITPAWLLLLWSGLGAATAAGIVATLIGGVTSASWSLAAIPRSRLHGFICSIGCGMFLYPIAYGLLFELLHRADFRTGLAVGAVHGLILFITTRRRAPLRPALRAAAAHFVYGIVIAFLYVTP